MTELPDSSTLPDNITEAPTGPHAPQQDLYRHVNGDWISAHTIPADRAVDGTFHQLRDKAEHDVRAIVEAQPEDSRIGALYASFMDLEGIEAAGLSVLTADLSPIHDAGSVSELAEALGRLDRVGVGGPVGYWIEKDSASDITRAYLTQSGLGLPDEAYYRDPAHEATRAEYLKFITTMLELTAEQPLPGRFADAALPLAADVIMRFETTLAEGHWDTIASRDADRTFNPTEVLDLPTEFPFARWLLASGVGPDTTTVIVRQPSYLEHVARMAQSVDLDEWKLWAQWRVIVARASLLGAEISAGDFDFYGRTLSGATEQRARWKRGLSLVEGLIGEEVGKVFVAEHFPAEYKKTMLTMVDYLIEAYRERITELPWMTPTTREKALEKLDLFDAKIGYPDRWRDFSGLEFSASGGDVLANVRAATAFNHDYEVAKLNKPADAEEWFANPQTVNAFYNPVKNDITFPAAILRPPFFDPDADMAGNFGAIGAVIGHEIGHGFDDQGSKYDGHGNLNSWWTDEDREAFTALTDKLVEQFDGLVPTGLAQRGITEHTVNGQFTLGENIGDLGGLGITIVALRRYLADQGLDVDTAPTAPVEGLEGEFTVLQRVFLRWARIWQTAIRPQMSIQYVSIDPHSPAEFRCNVVCSNIPEFYEAFGVTKEDAMWLPEDTRVQVW